MDSIRNFLNGAVKNYDIGVALYEAYGDSESMKGMFRQGESPYRKERLLDALDELLSAAKKSGAVPAAPEPPKASIVTIGHVMPENRYAEAKDPYREKWLPLYSKMKAKGHFLHEDMPDAERGTLAHEILDLEQQCMYWWKLTDIYLLTGNLVDESADPEEVTDVNAMTAQLLNVRASISKYRGKIKQDPENLQLQQKLKDFEGKRDILLNKLGK